MKLIDYIRGDRRGREANDLEKKAMADPFLSDAVEGYDAVYGNHFDMLQRLEEWVESRSARRRQSRRRKLWAIASAAAVVLAGAGVGYYFYNDRDPGDFSVAQILRDSPLADEISMAAFRETISDSVAGLGSAGYYTDGTLVDSAAYLAGAYLADSVPRSDLRTDMIAGIVRLNAINDSMEEIVSAGDINPVEAVMIAENSTSIASDAAPVSENRILRATDTALPESEHNAETPARNNADHSTPRLAVSTAQTPVNDNSGKTEGLQENIMAVPPVTKNEESAHYAEVATVDGETIEMITYPVFDEYFRKSRRLRNDPQGNPLRGDVVVEFRVNDAGVPSAIRIISSFSQDANREAMELLISGPRWTPTHGRRVRTVISYR